MSKLVRKNFLAFIRPIENSIYSIYIHLLSNFYIDYEEVSAIYMNISSATYEWIEHYK